MLATSRFARDNSAMDEPAWQRRLAFLRSIHVDSVEHSQRNLLDHLSGTHALLVAWNERPAICDAGLFHSVYGTEHFGTASIPLSQREQVKEIIGPEAERLAWLFGIMRRETFDENINRPSGFSIEHRLTGERIPLTREDIRDLVTLSFANTLEALPRLSWRLRRACRHYLTGLQPFAPTAAQQALQATNNHPAWQFWK
jgi:hypothetical protein